MTVEQIRDIAREHRFEEENPDSFCKECFTFIRKIAHGQIKVIAYPIPNVKNEYVSYTLIHTVLLIITRDLVHHKNYRQAFPVHNFQGVYDIFHSPQKFRKAKLKSHD